MEPNTSPNTEEQTFPFPIPMFDVAALRGHLKAQLIYTILNGLKSSTLLMETYREVDKVVKQWDQGVEVPIQEVQMDDFKKFLPLLMGQITSVLI